MVLYSKEFYLKELVKLNNIYKKDLPELEKDFEADITHYINEPSLSNIDLKNFHDLCLEEFKYISETILIKLEKLINSKSDYTKLFSKELDKILTLKTKLNRKDMTIKMYSEFYDNKIEKLKDQITEHKIKDGLTQKEKWIERVIGLFSGFFISGFFWFISRGS